MSYFRVDESGDGAVFDGTDHKNAQGQSYLGCGQANSLGVFGGFERFLHVFEYGLYSGIQSIYRFGYLAQNGIRNGDYLAHDLILANW